jgi:fido (protein-threonine AMPylation protein)
VYIPEYLISAKVLQNISAIEYSKAIIDITPLLENLELQLIKKTKTEKIAALLKLEGYLFPEEFIKKRIENLLDKSHVEVENVIKTIDLAKYLLDDRELEVESLKALHKSLSDKIIFESGSLRDTPDLNHTPYEEILAKLYDALDWFYSKDARDTHPLIACSILLARLVQIKPFKRFNSCVLLILFDQLLSKRGYSFRSYVSFVDFFSYHFQKNTLEQYIGGDEDLTHRLTSYSQQHC